MFVYRIEKTFERLKLSVFNLSFSLLHWTAEFAGSDQKTPVYQPRDFDEHYKHRNTNG